MTKLKHTEKALLLLTVKDTKDTKGNKNVVGRHDKFT